MSTVAGAGLVERRDHPWVQNQRREPRFGLAWAPFPDPDWATGRDLVQMAEALGYDSYWCMDHPTHAVDCWTRLAALATCTRTIRLGPLVSCVHFRSPAMLARVAADVDRLGDGRLVLGVGIGDLPWEFERLGLPFAETSVRQAALEEAVRIVRGLWEGEPFSFAGAHYRVQEAVLPAGPVQRPHVPILIAGGGERVTLRQVARHADASNFAASTLAGRAFTPDDVRRKLAALDAYCAEVGRPAESVLRSYVTLLTIVAPSAAAARRKRGAITFGPRLREAMRTSTVCGTPDDLVRFYRPILAAGISYLVFGVFHNDVETVRLLADEVMPALRADWRSPVPWAPPADGLAADAGRGAEPVPLGAWARTR